MKCFLLHGLSATPSSLRFLEQEIEDSYTISYDSHQSLDKSIAHIREIITDFIEPGEKFNLIGHSLGGVIACHLARHNDQVNKVVTIASPLGGSRAAYLLQWIVIGSPVLADLVPTSWYIKVLQHRNEAIFTVEADVLSIIATEGGWSVLGEENDGTVAIASQKALPYAKKVEIDANHFEVLLRLETLCAIKEFLNESNRT